MTRIEDKANEVAELFESQLYGNVKGSEASKTGKTYSELTAAQKKALYGESEDALPGEDTGALDFYRRANQDKGGMASALAEKFKGNEAALDSMLKELEGVADLVNRNGKIDKSNPPPTTTEPAPVAGDPMAGLSKWYKDSFNDEFKILSVDPKTGVISIEDNSNFGKSGGTHRERLKGAQEVLQQYGYELLDGSGNIVQLKPVNPNKSQSFVDKASKDFAELNSLYGKTYGNDTLKLTEIQSAEKNPVFVIEDLGNWGKAGGTHRQRLIAASKMLEEHGFKILEPEKEGPYLKLEYIGKKQS